MGPPPDEGGAGGSGTRRVGPGGRPRRMLVHDSAMGDREVGEGATATGVGWQGGGTRRGGRDAVVGGVAVAAAVDDNGEDDDGNGGDGSWWGV